MKKYWFVTLLLAFLGFVAHAQNNPPLSKTPEYKGFRLHMGDIELLKTGRKEFKIKCSLINTGKFPLTFGDGKKWSELVLTFDQSLKNNNMLDLQEDIKAALVAQKLTIKAGETVKDVKLSCTLKEELPEALKPMEPATASTKPQTDGEKPEKKEKPTVVTSKNAGDDAPKDDFPSTTSCIDLTIDTIKVVRIETKYIELEFTISNRGTLPAPIFGARKSNDDNVAVHFYFSGTPRLTRGALLADGIYLTEGLKDSQGMLEPNKTYTQRFKLSLERRNRFYGVIILQLDAFDVLRQECDETNNVKSIIPNWY